MPFKQDFEQSPDELKVLIDQYFQACDDNNKYYSEQGLCRHLGLHWARYQQLMDYAAKVFAVTSGRKELRDEIEKSDQSIQWPQLEVLAREVLRIGEQLAQRTDKMALQQVKNFRLGGYDDGKKLTGKTPDGSDKPLQVELSISGTRKGVDPFG